MHLQSHLEICLVRTQKISISIKAEFRGEFVWHCRYYVYVTILKKHCNDESAIFCVAENLQFEFGLNIAARNNAWSRKELMVNFFDSNVFWQRLKSYLGFNCFYCRHSEKVGTKSNLRISKISMEGQLIKESKDGDIDKVKQLLESSGININCQDIWIRKSFIEFQFNSFTIFQFWIISGIEFQYLIILLWFWPLIMAIPKLSNFYYHNQVLKSTAKTLENKNHS